MIVFVERTAGPGTPVKGVYPLPQPGYAEEPIDDIHPDVVAFNAPRIIGTPANDQVNRDNAKTVLDVTTAPGRLQRADITLTVQELNILRAQIVGIGTAVWNPANMANNTGVTSPVFPIAGAAFGDAVDVCAPYSLAGIIAVAYVSSPGNIQVRLHNGTGAAVDLASGTWKVIVRRHAEMPPRTKAQIINAIKAEVDNNS